MNFQGVIRSGTNNATTQFERLGFISTNMTNYNTTGFKSVRFEQVLKENGFIEGVERRNDEPGALLRTENFFDVGLDGIGFIPVTSKEGEIMYTRDGSFKLDKDGNLVTFDDCLVGEGIKVPANHEGFYIKEDGTVSIISQGDKPEIILGKIPLVTFPNSEGLEQGDNNKFLVTENSGEPILIKDTHAFKQGYLERSNVNLNDEIGNILRSNASMLASFRLLKAIDDMYGKAINLRS